MKIRSLQDSIEELASSIVHDASGLRQISSLKAGLEDLRSNLDIALNAAVIREYNGPEAIEQQVSNTGVLCFNKFDSNSLEEQPRQQRVSCYFGLHSPILAVSPKGIRWMIKKLRMCSDDRSMRESLYQLLKFFDASSLECESSWRMW